MFDLPQGNLPQLEAMGRQAFPEAGLLHADAPMVNPPMVQQRTNPAASINDGCQDRAPPLWAARNKNITNPET
jgi:hypothetical protein